MKKILIVRFSSIGDIVLTSPVVRCLKKQLDVELHYVTKKAFAPILAENPYLDKIFTLKDNSKELISKLKAEKYDYLIDLHKNLRTLRFRLALGVKTFSFDKLNFEKWLMVQFKKNRLPEEHIVDRYLEAVKPLEVKNDGGGLDYFLPEGAEDAVQEFLKSINIEEKDFIAFAIGAAHATKRLPAAKIIAICKKIKQPVLLLGGPSDAEEGYLVASKAGPHVINACGKLSLHQSAAAVHLASKVITHDTGMMHIASAFRKEIISVWGNTVPEFGMSPYYPRGENKNTTVEVKGLICRPCSKIGHESCPKKHFRCMEDIEEKLIEGLCEA